MVAKVPEAPRILLLAGTEPDPLAMGGVAVHVAALAHHAPPSVVAFTAAPRGGALLVEAWSPRRVVATLPFEGVPGGLGTALAAALAGTEADVLHVHSPLLGAEAIASAVRRSGVRAVFTLHDHSLVCENHELLEGGVRYCGIPADPGRCARCLATTRGRPSGTLPVHRASMRALVDLASAFVAPSDSVLAHAARIHPTIRDRARRIDWGVPAPRTRSARSAAEPGPLRIAVVGVQATVKGADRLPELFRACRDTDVEWRLFGATEGRSQGDLTKSAARVVVDGAYSRDTLAARLSAAGCHLVLLPSVGAESFSLVLSEVTAAGLPVVASRLGALGDRVARERLGWTFDPWNPEELAALVGKLAKDRSAIDAAARNVRARPHRSEEDMARDHAALWTEVAAAGQRSSERIVDEHARAEFERGRATGREFGRLTALVSKLRRSDFYRDLALRRMLPESMRRRVEERVVRWLSGSGRQ